MDYEKLGAIERPVDPRDYNLGAIQAPIQIPASCLPDNSWLVRNFQGQTPYCGSHSASHFKAILDNVITNGQLKERKTPRQIWIKIKTFDGHPLETGTDMRSIFTELRNFGAADYDPMGNDVTLPIDQYSSVSALTPDIEANAKQSIISSYAFTLTDYESLCQAVYQNKAVLLLIKCDEGFWHTTNPTFTTPKYGHFVVADGYDETGIRVIDSADPDDANAVKHIDKQYIQPQFIVEAGTAIDLPPSVKQALSQGQVSLAMQILEDMKKILGIDLQILKGRNTSQTP